MSRGGFFNMASSSLLVLTQILAIASAQTTSEASLPSSTLSTTTRPSATSSGSASSTEGPKTHTVAVGSGGFRFMPNKLENVKVNDVVSFEFYPPDHSVARAEFGSPCVPYEDTGRDKVGFWSDVQWVKTVKDITTWNLTINSTEPIFFYCTAKGSCLDQQMLGVINPNETQTLEAQIQYAKEATLALAPGEPIPAEHTGTLTMATGQPTASSAKTDSHDDHNEDHPHGLSKGAIAGIVVGAVAFLAICAALFFFVGRAKSLKEVINRKDATVKTTPDTPGTPGFPGFTAGPAGPMSPTSPYAYTPMDQQQHDYARMSGLPPYQQTSVTDAHATGWPSPQPQMAEKNQQPHFAAELASPQPQQTSFVAELEASTKTPRA